MGLRYLLRKARKTIRVRLSLGNGQIIPLQHLDSVLLPTFIQQSTSPISPRQSLAPGCFPKPNLPLSCCHTIQPCRGSDIHFEGENSVNLCLGPMVSLTDAVLRRNLDLQGYHGLKLYNTGPGPENLFGSIVRNEENLLHQIALFEWWRKNPSFQTFLESGAL